jgi:hypothetical protein
MRQIIGMMMKNKEEFPHSVMKYVYKVKSGADAWFDEDTYVVLLDDYRPSVNSGLFRGARNGIIDEEVCSFDEFEIKDRNKREDKDD